MVLDKIQFDVAKSYLMDPNNPNRISLNKAKFYKCLGFITDEEFENYNEVIKSKNTILNSGMSCSNIYNQSEILKNTNNVICVDTGKFNKK